MARTHDQASGSLAGSSAAMRRLSSERPPGVSAPLGAIEAAEKDPLSEVLRTVKLTGALFFLVDATSPWGVEVPHARAFAPIILPGAQHVVSYHIVLQGSGYASLPGMTPVQFAAGDIVVVPHADPYAMLSTPGQAPEMTPETSLGFFRDMAAGKLPFVIQEGGGGPERARFVCGFLGCDVRPFNPLLGMLPRLLHMKRPSGTPDDLLDGLIDLTLTEARARNPGSESIRLGLSELIFIEVIRRYVATRGADETGWLAGLRDPAVGRALTLLHEHPADDWTLDELVKRAGVSRSVLADRFTHLVGYPPMQYLMRWRVQLAARQLADGTKKIAAIGRDVGYQSEAAFSRTFKRIAGVSPAAWRSRRSGS
ncbi:AraC family transcriptional regulator [Dongia deserti]|uniref:AraC family transcriptional regulator n=1 Tax=Dongia deserti TaxID=2268030 RepID=UPI002546CD15|nr:AraC family transcriptional regulator [Dongia deserti]